MKKCPRCGQFYTDSDINFCLNDGELLSRSVESSGLSSDEPPPTVFMDQPARTTQLDWEAAQPPAPYQRPMPPYGTGPAGAVMAVRQSQDMTLAIVSMAFGLGSITIGWCCSLGLLLSPIAIVTGGISFYLNNKDPEKYGGKGFAVAGIATGAIFMVLYILLMLIYGLALFLPR